MDLLEAHSNIRPSRDVSRDRAKASGVRNYGEDVADRNIAAFDLNSPEFSYLKSVYGGDGSVARASEGISQSRAASERGNVLGQEQPSSDDIHAPRDRTKANSSRSTHNSTPRASSVYPPRIDSTSAVSCPASRRRDDDRSASSNGAHDPRHRELSPFSSTTDSIDEEPEEPSQRCGVPPTSTPPIPARGQARISTKEPSSPLVISSRVVLPAQSQQKPSANIPSLKHHRRNMSEASQSSVASVGTHSRSGSATYTSIPYSGRQDHQIDNQSATRERPYSTANNNKTGMIVEGTKEPPSLGGVVDLSNTVDTDVTTKTLPGTDPPPIPAMSSMRFQSNTSRPLSLSSRSLQRLSNLPSPLCVHPPGVYAPPAFPPEDWPLPSPPLSSLNQSISKAAANMPQ